MRLFQAPLDTCLGSPFSASLSVHGLHFTVYAASKKYDSSRVAHLKLSFSLESEDAIGGWKKEGGGKPHEWHPSQKGVLDPPRTVRCPPPSDVSALFFLYKNPQQSRPEALLEGSKVFRQSTLSGTFSSPHTFCTPPYHGPIETPWSSLFFFGENARKTNKNARIFRLFRTPKIHGKEGKNT